MNNEKVEQAKRMARDYYKLPNCGCGGSLHIVLDDGNIETGSVQFCLDWAAKECDQPGVELATFLLTLTEDERQEVYETFWKHE